jgi:hypothetical protein
MWSSVNTPPSLHAAPSVFEESLEATSAPAVQCWMPPSLIVHRLGWYARKQRRLEA